jgi:hypothetical protein
VRDCSWLLLSRYGLTNVRPDNFICSSDRTPDPNCVHYNCIAWAAGKSDKWWWPSHEIGDWWPIPVNDNDPENIAEFFKAFATEGFTLKCNDESYEDGFEKVAFFANSKNKITHAARQLSNGSWTSKMGWGEDIEHLTLTVVECPIYGKATHFLKKPNAFFKKNN